MGHPVHLDIDNRYRESIGKLVILSLPPMQPKEIPTEKRELVTSHGCVLRKTPAGEKGVSVPRSDTGFMFVFILVRTHGLDIPRSGGRKKDAHESRGMVVKYMVDCISYNIAHSNCTSDLSKGANDGHADSWVGVSFHHTKSKQKENALPPRITKKNANIRSFLVILLASSDKKSSAKRSTREA
jgi:hypothetical protein